jgi:hypothetical protein
MTSQNKTRGVSYDFTVASSQMISLTESGTGQSRQDEIKLRDSTIRPVDNALAKVHPAIGTYDDTAYVRTITSTEFTPH